MAPQLMCRNGIYVDYEKMAAEGVIHPRVRRSVGDAFVKNRKIDDFDRK